VPDLLRSAFHHGPVTVTLDDVTYTFPYRTASQWLSMVSGGHWALDVLRSADAESYERFVQRAEDGEAGPDDLQRIARAALAEASGFHWWEAERLMSLLGEPRMLGTVLHHGADPDRLSLAAVLAIVYSLIMQGSEKDQVKVEAEISVPPPGAVTEEDGDEDFSAMVDRMRSLPGISIG
jgi:hypothetical protein